MTEPFQRNQPKFLPAFLLLLCLGVIMSPTRPAYACSCVRPPAPNQALADATVVFSGQVTNIERVKGRLNVTFHVDKHWKGEPAQSLIVQTFATTAMCGYPFKVGQIYLVYAKHRQGKLQTNQCSRTNLLSRAAEDLSVFDR